ncbi:MAG: hypothetical protein HRT94_05740 [Alphaproteobacteria bacterium]|nr:hypothetical protein [Alphaproteobacteria bacterium]
MLGLGKMGMGLAKQAIKRSLVDILHPATYDTKQEVLRSTDINDAYNATSNHTFVIDFKIEDPLTPPASNQTIFAFSLQRLDNDVFQFSNYIWLRRLSSGGLGLYMKSGNTTYLNQTIKEEMLYINKVMRLGITIDASGNLNIYISGRRYLTATSKLAPNINENTAIWFNSTFASDSKSNDGLRFRYYDTAKARHEAEFITNVSLKELGLSYTQDVDALGVVGAGQSNMSGGEDPLNKTAPPQVSAGLLDMLNVNGAVMDFDQDWFDPDGETPLFKAFSQTFAGSGYATYAGYMGDLCNEISEKLNKRVVTTCAAASGTDIAADWAGGRTDINHGAGTTEMVGYMTWCLWEAIRQMQAICGKVIIYDDQGTTDALNSLSEADYELQKQAQIDWLNYYFPDLEYYFMGFNEFNAASPISEVDFDNIDKARQDVVSANADCAFVFLKDVTVSNADGLHYLVAEHPTVSKRGADAYTGGDVYEITDPAAGITTPAELSALNNMEEGFILVRTKPTYATISSDQYPVHINRGGSSPAVGIRVRSNEEMGNVYRDDTGDGYSGDNDVDGGLVEKDVYQSMVTSWSVNRDLHRSYLNAEHFEQNNLADTEFANPNFTHLAVGSRNGGSNAYTGTSKKILIGNTFLSRMAMSKLLHDPQRLSIWGGAQSMVKGIWSSAGSGSDGGIIALKTAVRSFVPDIEIVDYNASEGGSAIDPRSVASGSNPDEYWLDEGNHVAQELKQFIDALKSMGLSNPKILWDLGITDSHRLDLVDQVSLAEFEEKMVVIMSIVRKIAPDAEFHFLNLARRTTFSNTGAYQKLRDLYKKLASKYSYCYLCPELYDLDLVDQVHRTDPHEVTAGTRLGRHFAYLAGETVSGSVYGAKITSATRSGTSVTVTIEHDGGSDITPSSGIEGFVFHDDGTPITINSAVRTDATTITLTLASEPTGVETLYYGYDAMTELHNDVSGTSVISANIVRDNSAQTMPLQTAKISL